MSHGDPDYDDYDYDDDYDSDPGADLAGSAGAPRLRRLARMLVPVLLIGGGGFLLWDGYRAGGGDSIDVPVLRADTSDMRQRPDNPGGMEVPFRDRVILLQTSMPPAPAPDAVTLMRPEVPLARDLEDENGVVLIGDLLNRGDDMVAEAILPRGSGAPELGVSYRESAMLDSLISEMADAPDLSLPPLETLPGNAADPLALLIDETVTVDAAVPASAASGPVAGQGGFAVQLATVRSLEDVTVEWRRQARIFTGILDGVGLIEDEAQIRSGQYLRVLVGPLVEGDAQALCQRIRGAGGDCFVSALDYAPEREG